MATSEELVVSIVEGIRRLNEYPLDAYPSIGKKLKAIDKMVWELVEIASSK